jgi:hypothetical protein
MAFAKKTVDTETRIITIQLEDGSSTSHALDSLPPAIITQLALHGLSQKLGDSYAGAENAVAEGEAETKVGFAKSAVARVWTQLSAGEWSAKREGTGGISMLARAIAEVLGITPEDAAAKVEGMDKETKKKVQSSPKVAVALAKLKAAAAARAAERAAAAAEAAGGEDVASLLG